MDPLTIIALAVGIAVVTAPIGIRMFPVCSAHRGRQLTGSYSSPDAFPHRVELREDNSSEHDEVSAPIKAAEWVPMPDRHIPPRPILRPHWEPNQATRALIAQFEDEPVEAWAHDEDDK